MTDTQKPLALVTGASAGLGEVFAERLAKRGFNLIIVARREDRLHELSESIQKQYDVDVTVSVCDLGHRDDLAKLEQHIKGLDALDLLVNNAGFAVTGPVATQSPDQIEEMLQLNIIALARLSRAALPGMLARKAGTIINVSSGTAFMQMAGAAAYAASKSFVLAFTESLNAEVGSQGITIQALCPGIIRTEFHKVAGGDVSQYPPQFVMSPEDVVDASLSGLDLGEVVCIPSLPNIEDWNKYTQARGAVAQVASKDTPAARYHVD